MTVQESILMSQVKALWERLLNVKDLSLDDDFFEKGGWTALAVQMIFELEQLTGRKIPTSILFEATTIRQLVYSLSQKDVETPKYLIQLNRDGSKKPLIFFHGDYIWGGFRMTFRLARLLGQDQPLLVVVPHGIDGSPIRESVEAMAAERLRLIVSAQPKGPYRICGNCLGGIVATEVARMLVASGEKVDILFMIDSPTVNVWRSLRGIFWAMKLARPIAPSRIVNAGGWTWFKGTEFQKFLNISWARRWAGIARRLPKFLGRDDSRGNRPEPAVIYRPVSTTAESFSQAFSNRTAQYSAAMADYVPQPLHVRTTYIVVEYGARAWRRMAPNLEIVKSGGTHLRLNIPHVANIIKGRLDAVDAATGIH